MSKIQPSRSTRGSRSPRPIVRAMLTTTAVAWSIGVHTPAADTVAPRTTGVTIASNERVRGNGLKNQPPPGASGPVTLRLATATSVPMQRVKLDNDG